jgi:serine/threonine protein kinase
MRILDIAIQIAGALFRGARCGNRPPDIKPENIVLRPDGYVKILDFGLAKLLKPQELFVDGTTETAIHNATAQGVIMGTVSYMSPEQAKAETVDQRTDIFSLGVVVYELLTGTTPFQADSMSETFANLINAEPAPINLKAADVPEELQRIVTKMLRKDADERYQTCDDLLTDLKSLKENIAFDRKLSDPRAEGSNNPTAFLRRDTDRVIDGSDYDRYHSKLENWSRKMDRGRAFCGGNCWHRILLLCRPK